MLDNTIYSCLFRYAGRQNHCIRSWCTPYTMTSTAKRIFPPLYSPTGNESEDRLEFFHILERLKVTRLRAHYLC